MNYTQAREYLKGLNQEQLLDYYNELTASEQTELLNDIKNTDFGIIKYIGGNSAVSRGKISPIEAVGLAETKRRSATFAEVGIKFLAEGKVGAVLLAGGQGSRLGFDKPKGMYNIGQTRTLSIFEQQMTNALDVVKLTGRHFPLFIMTSRINNDDTVAFFKQNNFFGYPQDRVFFFVQDEAPTCSKEGKVYLDQKYRVSLAPNGNGGWYSSLVNSGLGKIVEGEGIEWLNVYSVDNVLQRMCDPVFIGATVIKGCNCGAKVVKKVGPDEKVGVLCNEDGKPSVIEYYEMDENLKNERKDGELVYCYGVTLNYIFNVRKLNSIVSGKLPYHLAEKKIAHMENGVRVTPAEPCGYKFETLVVDMVRMMESCLAFEVDRQREFAPVKNLTGVDSVDTARELLKKNGIKL